MTATILDGKATSKALQAEIDAAVAEFKAATGITPTIAVVRAGEDPASVWYANAIKKTMPTVPSRIQRAVAMLPTNCSRSVFTTGRWRSMIRT